MYIDPVVVFSDCLIVEPPVEAVAAALGACGDGCVGCPLQGCRQIVLLLVQITWWLVRTPPLAKGGFELGQVRPSGVLPLVGGRTLGGTTCAIVRVVRVA